MRYPLTLGFALFGAALILFNYSGYDPHNLFFLMFSVPMWFVELFTDIHKVNVWTMYVLTLLSYALIGWLGDFVLRRSRQRRSL